MMFVKHCPDPALSAVLTFKTADKWKASEIQEMKFVGFNHS